MIKQEFQVVGDSLKRKKERGKFLSVDRLDETCKFLESILVSHNYNILMHFINK